MSSPAMVLKPKKYQKGKGYRQGWRGARRGTPNEHPLTFPAEFAGESVASRKPVRRTSKVRYVYVSIRTPIIVHVLLVCQRNHETPKKHVVGHTRGRCSFLAPSQIRETSAIPMSTTLLEPP